MHVLEDLKGELREVEDGFVSCEHDIKGYIFRGVTIRRLNNKAYEKMEIYEFDGINRKESKFTNTVTLVLHYSLGTQRREQEWGVEKWREEGQRRGVSLDWPNVKGDKKREKTAREGKEKERREYVILDSLVRCTTN